jgi:integrase
MPYKRGHKWVAEVRRNGKRKQALFRTKTEAQAWETEWRKKPPEDWQESVMTTESSLINWANDYLTYARAMFTIKTYNEKKLIFRRLFKLINPDLPVSALTARQALDFLQNQAEVRSGYAANKERKNLLAAWNWGIKYMALPTPNPFLVDKFPEQRQPRYIPPERDFWKVYEVAEDQDKIMLLAYLQLAARRSEIFRLRWQDVDFVESRVRITTRKRQGGHLEEDWLPMLDELSTALLQHKQTNESEWVFIDPQTRGPYKCRRHWMGRLCSKAGVRPFGLHAIRHLTASILANEGVPVIAIQSILRHKSMHVTQRYLHQLKELRSTLKVLSKRKSLLAEPSPSTSRPTELRLVK